MQFFKGDEQEQKVYNSFEKICNDLSLQQDLFFEDAYNAYPLGGVIYDNDLAPLANAIDRDIFISSFNEIFAAFPVAGTFESYISVFKKIFGDDVSVEFEVPAPGKLNITIVAAGLELSQFVSRYISNNQYFFDEMITQDGDFIVFQTVKGFETQYELEQMLFELVPAGIFTNISLTIG